MGEVDARLVARLDALLARTVKRQRYVRHGLLAVAAVDGSRSWQGARGVADEDGAPVTTEVRYPIASVTKLFTATVVLKLEEQGELAITDRMVEHLSPEVTEGLHVLDGVDRTDEITIEHLLRHTSGLPDYYEGAPKGERSPQQRLLAGEDVPVPFEEVLRIVREDLTPHFPPQPADADKRKAHYADTNYQLLGAVIEAVTGEPLHEVFDTMLLEPLGLDDTASYPHPPRSFAAPAPQVKVWSKDTVLRPEGALTTQGPDGGIISTLTDQVRFLQAIVAGEVFDDPSTWQRMQERTDRIFFPIEYGLGVMRYAPARWMSPAYRIPPVVGHTGSTATWLFHCAELDVVIAGAFDVAQPPLPFRFVPRVLRAVQTAGR
jgi:D-alanyl-D-alanine carboxypeptidase